MAEVIIEPLECVWRGDWKGFDGEIPVGSVGYWLDGGYGAGAIRPGLDRRPIFVMCPAWRIGGVLHGTAFCVDTPSTTKNEYWDVTVDMESLVLGQKPRVTVHPSIHLVGIWHGWLQDGILHQ